MAARKARVAECRQHVRDLAALDLALKGANDEELTPAEGAEVMALFDRIERRGGAP